MEEISNEDKGNHMIRIRYGEFANEIRQQGSIQTNSRHNLAVTVIPFPT